MTDLVERLEGAAAGSRELDCEVWCLFDGWAGVDHPPSVTTSIDAAVALAERVLPGWYVGIQANRRWDIPDDWTAYLSPPSVKDGPEFEASSKTGPLALCAAIIRAHAEQVQG